MRHASVRSGLASWLLALYLGVGLLAPVADAALFHLGAVERSAAPAWDEAGAGTQHGVCVLGEHARETLAPAIRAAAIVAVGTCDRSALPAPLPPRDREVGGLPLSRAPPDRVIT